MSSVSNLASPNLEDLRDAYFSLLTHSKQLLLVTFCDTTAKIGNSEVGRDAAVAVWTERREG